MDILIYNELNPSHLKKQYDKIVEMLRHDDFYSAEVKKLTPTPYYRAKLDYANRLLFRIVTYQQKNYILILEIIPNHAYEKSRFLNGATIDENKLTIITKDNINQQITDPIFYLNDDNPHFHILDKIISFDWQQDNIFNHPIPLIIIGSAGSGKTMLTLEKMKSCPGSVLYVTNSPYLVQNARDLYYANYYTNDDQEVEFLSYN